MFYGRRGSHGDRSPAFSFLFNIFDAGDSMSLQLYYGSSQSNRTAFIYEEVLKEAELHPDKRYILLVPEQASLITQKEMIVKSHNHALFNIDVLTFNRLAYRVFEDLNESEANVLNDTGKDMLLRLVMKRNTGSHSPLRRNLNKKGFVEEMKSLISEFVQYNITPEKLKGSLDQLTEFPYLKDKLTQVAEIYEDFMELLGRDYRMAEERMTLLSGCISVWPKIKDTSFILEGFTGFTPPQYAVIACLIRQAEKVTVGLTLGTGETLENNKREEDLFSMTQDCAAVLKEQAIMANVAFAEVVIAEKRPVSKELDSLERNLYRAKKEPGSGKVHDIILGRTSSRHQEAEVVLSMIRKNIRDGYEYRELGIIVSDMTAYREELENVLTEAGIPCFFDQNRDLSHDPLFLLIKALLETAKNDYAFENVVSVIKNPVMQQFLKTRLPLEDRLSVYERACEFENFLLASGIRGRKSYDREWTGAKKTAAIRMTAVNELRTVLTETLFPLTDLLKEENSTGTKITALKTFLQEIGAEEIMQSFAGEAAYKGDVLLSEAYKHSVSSLAELFDLSEKLLAPQELSLSEFSDVLTTGLSEIRLGLAPPTIDRLVIGDLRRTRLTGIKKLYLMGANEGMLPQNRSEGGLLSDMDREILKENHIDLAPGSREESFNDRLYIYLALTLPEETLCITYAASDRDGKVLSESPVINELKTIFPDLKVSPLRKGFLSTERAGVRYLSTELQKAYEQAEREGREPEFPPDIRGLYQILRKDKALRDAFILMEEGLYYRSRKESLSDSVTEALFKHRLSGSVSRLEQYASCAYRHFLNYGLDLEERPEYELNAADFGTLFHKSIDAFFVKLKEKGLSWQDVDLKTRAALAEESVLEATREYGFRIFDDNARNEYLVKRMLRLTDRTLWALKEQWDRGGFTKTETEVSFYGGRQLKGLNLPLDKGLSLTLQGRIDRLDLSEEGDKVYVRVIDYKSGSTDLDFTKVWYGLQLQLLLYMEAARELVHEDYPDKTIIPAGFYYYHIDDPIVEKSEEDVDMAILKKLRLSGVTNIDPKAVAMTDKEAGRSSVVVKSLGFTKDKNPDKHAKVADTEAFGKLSDFVLNKSKDLAGSILAGDISVNPYRYGQEDACKYCDFKGVCGFDERLPGFRKRFLRKKTLEDLIVTDVPEHGPAADKEEEDG